MTARSPLPSRRDALGLLGLAGAGLVTPLGLAASAPSASAAEAAPAAPAAAAGAAQGAGFYRFKVGDIEAAVVSDGALPPMPLFPIFGGNAGKEAVEAALKREFLPVDKARAVCNTLLLKTGKDLLLADTGCGKLFGPDAGRQLAHLAAAGVKPEDVTAVLLTHAHGDHFGGLLTDDGKPVFPNATVLVSAAEKDFWFGAADLSKAQVPDEFKKEMVAGARKALDGVKGKLQVVKPGDKIAAGVTVVDAPGHTPGHLAVAVNGGDGPDAGLLHIADAAHHFALTLAHPEWKCAFDVDPDLSCKTRREMLSKAAENRTLLMGYHLPFPGLGHVRKTSDGFEWVPVVWQWQ
jgi:glyoxylase-like metal-dependent hydrolase (beta-lactamase superfamily II)